MPLNTRASFTLSTPSMAGRIAGLLQSSLQTAVTAVCYFPMISWWLAYITVNFHWKHIHAHNMLFLRLTKSRALFYLTPTWYDVVGRLVSLPFLIPEPFKEKRHGSCMWFLARSDDDKWLMIVRTYRTCCFAGYSHSHCKVFEQDPSFSGPSGIFDWRLVSSLGTCSLFVGLNYPINQEITDGKDHDGSAISFIRQNYVYTAYHSSLHAPYPDMCFHAL